MKRGVKAKMIASETVTVVSHMLEGFASCSDVNEYVGERLVIIYDLYHSKGSDDAGVLKVFEDAITALWLVDRDDCLSLILRHYERVVRGIKRLAASVENP